MSSVLFLVNKTLGKYQVIEHLGHGGMAEVYKAQQVNLDRMVALKVLHPFLAEEEGFIERFQREARIVATLRHPNIVQVIDFDHDVALDIYYMVMEYIEGPTLKDVLKDAPLPYKKAVRIAAGIADALDYAHKRGMVHRDIKPANIMFTDEDSPVLTDFGIARMMDLKGLTASGAMVGTPAYMAPEVGLGQPGEAPSDIYSLGVVLYQMLAAQLPFDSDVPMGLVMKHINDPVPPLSKWVANIPPELEATVIKSLAKKPLERFKTGGEMAQALRVAVGLETPSAPTTPIPATATPSRPEPGSPTDEHEPLLRTWPSLRVQPSLLEQPALPENVIAAPPPERRRVLPWIVRGVIGFLLLVLLGLGGWGAANGLFPLPFVSPSSTSTATVSTNVSPLTLTPTVEATNQVTETQPGPTATPNPTATAMAACSFRADVGRLYTIPSDDVLPPETQIVAYIPLRNVGNCAWPEGVQLVFVSGEQLGAPTALPIGPVGAGQRAQVILPLHAPLDVGEYLSVWEVRLPEGQRIANPIRIPIVVADVPAFTPTPGEVVEVTATPQTPLTFDAPVLLRWREDPAQGLWTGTLKVQAAGGAGVYRYYYEAIRSETAITGDEWTFQWQRCEDFPLTLWIVSGESTLRWDGQIPFPAPERCEP